jgi:hypothetical protein
MITFSCPTCSSEYTVPPEKSGMRTKCPRCGEVLAVPGPKLFPNEPAQSSEGKSPLAATAQQVVAVPSPPELHPKPSGSVLKKNQPKAVPVLIGGIALLAPVAVIAGLGSTGSRHAGTTSATTGDAAPAFPVPSLSPAEQAKKSFGALVDRVRAKLPNIPPEPLPPSTQNALPFPGQTDIRTECVISVERWATVSDDLEATPSLSSPFKGTVRFGARETGTLSGTSRGSTTAFPFSFPFKTDERVTATYLSRDGRWSLTEVAFTVTDFTADAPLDAPFVSRGIAYELNRSKGRVVGRTRTFPGSTDVAIVRGLREAATE